MKSLASYETLIPLLEANIPMLGGFPERTVGAYYFSGDVAKAISLTEELVAKYEEGDSDFSFFTDNFGRAFLEMTKKCIG
jgi:hypothetical protein